jgi:hypothetical protein
MERIMIPCKFCGGRGILEIYKYSDNKHFPEHTVRCKRCGARTQNGKTAQEATDHWEHKDFLPVFESEPARAEEMSSENVILCIECILEESTIEYRKLLQDMYSKRYSNNEQLRMLKAAIEKCERSFRLSHFVAATGMSGDEIIDRIREEEQRRYAKSGGRNGRRYRLAVH